MKAILCSFSVLCCDLPVIVCNYILKTWLHQGGETKLGFLSCKDLVISHSHFPSLKCTILVTGLKRSTQSQLMHRKEKLIFQCSSFSHFSKFELSLFTLKFFCVTRIHITASTKLCFLQPSTNFLSYFTIENQVTWCKVETIWESLFTHLFFGIPLVKPRALCLPQHILYPRAILLTLGISSFKMLQT